jgi:hypothetical protein
MALLGRGRLSVQPVNDPVALEAVELLAEKGGWTEETYAVKKSAGTKRDAEAEPEDEEDGEQKKPAKKGKKAKGKADGEEPKPKPPRKGFVPPSLREGAVEGSRRSSRLKTE